MDYLKISRNFLGIEICLLSLPSRALMLWALSIRDESVRFTKLVTQQVFDLRVYVHSSILAYKL